MKYNVSDSWEIHVPQQTGAHAKYKEQAMLRKDWDYRCVHSSKSLTSLTCGRDPSSKTSPRFSRFTCTCFKRYRSYKVKFQISITFGSKKPRLRNATLAFLLVACNEFSGDRRQACSCEPLLCRPFKLSSSKKESVRSSRSSASRAPRVQAPRCRTICLSPSELHDHEETWKTFVRWKSAKLRKRNS